MVESREQVSYQYLLQCCAHERGEHMCTASSGRSNACTPEVARKPLCAQSQHATSNHELDSQT